MSDFCIPFKQKWTPFKRCDECGKRKLSTCFYEVDNQGLTHHIDVWCCKKCMKEAKERVKNG